MCAISNRGFTMMELMITISIAAIMMSIAAPSYQSLMIQSRLTTQANQLSTALHYARSEAVKRGMRVTVCKSDVSDKCVAGSSWADGWIVFSNGKIKGTIDDEKDILRVFDGTKGSQLESNFGNWVYYKPNGQSNKKGTFSLCNGAEGRDIVINITGRISVRPAKEGSCPLSD